MAGGVRDESCTYGEGRRVPQDETGMRQLVQGCHRLFDGRHAPDRISLLRQHVLKRRAELGLVFDD